MPYQLWSQDNFSKGELSPYMYARAQVAQYYEGLKTAQNVLSYPTGAAGKRFGTLYQATISSLTTYKDLFFQTFQWFDIACYQLVFVPKHIYIYLEGMLVADVTTTFDGQTVYNLSSTTIDGAFRVAGRGFKPRELTNAANVGNVILTVNTDSLTLTTPVVAGLVLPVTFTTTGTLPTTNPQIKAGVYYFYKAISTTVVELYETAYDAKFGLNKISISTAPPPTGVNTLIPWNNWSFNACTFRNLPFYDFNGVATSYDAITFTPAAPAGSSVIITLSAPYAPLVVPSAPASQYIGGVFIGGGGTSRIISVTDSTHFTVAIQQPFGTTGGVVDPILGSLALLAEPAWSESRGWPQKCSSYQNRALFANTESLPNGFWASVVNEYINFSNLTTDDDDGIAWFPSSNEINVIRFIVPFRSITVHTNSGIYSSPLSEFAAITPKTFTLQLQDSTPADVLQPQAIDNQIIVLSGNDVHTMVWDGINNAYRSNIVSIASEHLIRDPLDETAYADLARAGSRYVFIINTNGSMAVYQTLQAEQVSGFTPQILEQSYGAAQFRQVASNFDGRAWFVNERQIGTVGTSKLISFAVTPTVLVPQTEVTATGSNFDTEVATAVKFTTAGSFPASSPALNTTDYFWVIGLTVDTFEVYENQSDATAQINAIEFTSAGVGSNVVPWNLSKIFTLEELNQDVFLDCAFYYNGVATDTVTTGALFNAQDIKMLGDGFGFDAQGNNNQVEFIAHGEPVEVSKAWIGFPIHYKVEPMPLSPPPNQNTSLTKPNHIRSVRFMFNNTIGGTINDVPITLDRFNEAEIGDPPTPSRGVFEMMIMKGWDDFNLPSFTIEHSDPFNIELIGIFYSVDI